jgi:hypothetical protein
MPQWPARLPSLRWWIEENLILNKLKGGWRMSYSLEILEVIHSGALPISMPLAFWQRPALLALSRAEGSEVEGPHDPPCERSEDQRNNEPKELENHEQCDSYAPGEAC